jgi:hypothetical protein
VTRLSGEFETDLASPEALAACAEAIDRLGYRIESVEADRIVSYAEAGNTGDPARIEIVVRDAVGGSELRITGSSRTAGELERQALIAELDRARDAIAVSIEDAEEAPAQSSRFAGAPLFAERSLGLRVLGAAVVPAVFGAVSGVVLGVSAGIYWVLQIVALIGAVLGGLEHPNAREAARRGLVGGTIYGAFILIAHAVVGTDPEIKLPDFAPVLVVFTAVIGALASALGGWLRGRSEPAGR